MILNDARKIRKLGFLGAVSSVSISMALQINPAFAQSVEQSPEGVDRILDQVIITSTRRTPSLAQRFSMIAAPVNRPG